MGMESVYTLVWIVIGAIVLVGLVAYIMGKVSGNDDFGALEKLVAAYVGIAALVWMYEGYLGSPVLPAISTALAWPLTVFNWAKAQAK